MESQVSGEMPYSRDPISASPLNFNITRRYLGGGADVVVILVVSVAQAVGVAPGISSPNCQRVKRRTTRFSPNCAIFAVRWSLMVTSGFFTNGCSSRQTVE